jgi:hypothetical protein
MQYSRKIVKHGSGKRRLVKSQKGSFKLKYLNKKKSNLSIKRLRMKGGAAFARVARVARAGKAIIPLLRNASKTDLATAVKIVRNISKKDLKLKLKLDTGGKLSNKILDKILEEFIIDNYQDIVKHTIMHDLEHTKLSHYKELYNKIVNKPNITQKEINQLKEPVIKNITKPELNLKFISYINKRNYIKEMTDKIDDKNKVSAVTNKQLRKLLN